MAQTTICNFGVYLIAVEVRILRRQNKVCVSEEEQGEEAIVKSKAETIYFSFQCTGVEFSTSIYLSKEEQDEEAVTSKAVDILSHDGMMERQTFYSSKYQKAEFDRLLIIFGIFANLY